MQFTRSSEELLGASKDKGGKKRSRCRASLGALDTQVGASKDKGGKKRSPCRAILGALDTQQAPGLVRVQTTVLQGSMNQRKKKGQQLKKLFGMPAGCRGTPRDDKQGSAGRCPKDFLLFTIEKLAERDMLLGDRPGFPGTRCCAAEFQKFYVILPYVPFLLPNGGLFGYTETPFIGHTQVIFGLPFLLGRDVTFDEAARLLSKHWEPNKPCDSKESSKDSSENSGSPYTKQKI